MSPVNLRKYEELKKFFHFQQPLVWRNVIGITVLHIIAVYAIPLFLYCNIFTFTWGVFIGNVGGLGITAGAHRLWTHRAYKAKLPLRIFLMFCYLMSGQYSMVQWARDHRLHHKFSDTNADPHNASRGLFFSHCGWLMMKRHPEVKEKGKLIDVSDLWEDPVVVFQQRYFVPLLIILFVIFPSAIPMIFWKEDLSTAVFVLFFLRYTLQLNLTWIVNSFAHYKGTKPYNKSIRAVQNKYVAFFSQGEGWHNYHHVFPWDYRVGEYGQEYLLAGQFIEFCEKIGLAYDLKSATPEMIYKVLTKANKGSLSAAPREEISIPK